MASAVAAVANGAQLRKLRANGIYRSASAAADTFSGSSLGLGATGSTSHCRHFTTLPALSHAADAGTASRATTPEAAAAEDAAKKTGRASYWFVGVAGATIIGSLAYPLLFSVPPQDVQSKSPEADSPPPPPAPAAPAPSIVPPLPSVASVLPSLSPREQLIQRLDTLKADLADLRKEKRTQLIDMQKQGIKDEIKMIESGLKKLDKS